MLAPVWARAGAGRTRTKRPPRVDERVVGLFGVSTADVEPRSESDIDAARTVVGQLVDDVRRRVLAAVELGASDIDAIVAAAGVGVADVERACARLVAAGLIVGGDTGLRVDATRFQLAGRQLLARPPRTEHADADPVRRKVLDAFVRDGRIAALPVAPAKRAVVLDWVAQRFEPGRRFAEREVNEILAAHTDDVAMLRRSLVDHALLDRDAGEYWRCGGDVPPATG